MPPEENNPNIPPVKPEEEELGDYTTPHLRTYKDDIKNVVESQDISSTRILLDEQRRRSGEAAQKEASSLSSNKNRVLLMVSLALIAVAGGVLGFIWFYPKTAPTDSRIIIARANFLEVDGQTIIPTELRNQRDILADIQRLLIVNLPAGLIEEIILARNERQVVNGENVSTPKPIPTEALFQLLESRVSSALIRSVDSEFMLGLYGTGTSVKPYLLFKINDFDNVFASLLSWESGMARDMQPIFFANIKAEELSRPRFANPTPIVSGTSTSTNTPPVEEKPMLSFDPTVFKDRIIQNTDARAIINDRGELVFFYTFLNDEYLVFAQSENVLEEVARRLRQAKLIR